MRARLFARYGPEAGLELEFTGEATIGRGKQNSVLLGSREVSQNHARILFDEESAAYWIEDLGSLNGTHVDGEPVTRRQRLAGLHVLGFGGAVELFFLELDVEAGADQPQLREEAEAEEEPEARPEEETLLPDDTAEPEGTRIDADVPTLPPGLRASDVQQALADRPGSATHVDQAPADLPASLAGGGDAQAAPAAGPRFALEVLDEPGGRFELAEGEHLLGRSGRADIVLAHRELSRRHATLRVAEGRVWLRDEGSRNHTYVGDEEISEEVELVPGSELRFGRLRARLSPVAAAASGKEE